MNGQLQSIKSTNALMYSSSMITSLISSAVMQSVLSVHDSIALMVIHMPGISFISWDVLLQVHSHVNDVSVLNGSYTSAVDGKNFLM